MYQLLIVDENNNVVGVCTNNKRLPNVEEVYPNRSYTGIETPYNEDIVNRYYDFYYDGQNIVEKGNIEYTVDKTQITTTETAIITITNPATVTAIIDNQEYTVSDGIIEYNNENVGTHQVVLKAEGYKDTRIIIEVI